MARKIHYAIVHIPISLIHSANDVLTRKKIDSSYLIFSTDHTLQPDKTVTLEDTSLEFFGKQGQKAVTLYLPIKETNKHSKLPVNDSIRIDIYFSR